ncbi:MAG: hypothetical protein H7Y20_08395 [Bryobacteraceae bacterium]|nr:hypothetical protein [Bryobacteraceae bacterium]
MKARRCCTFDPENRKQSTFRSRFADIAGWLLPAAILALLPKCPACLVVYVAVATGFSFSVGAAAYLRMLILMLCLTSVAFLAIRHVRRTASR